MDLVIIVSGNWIKKNKYVFKADSRGCRVLHLDENSTHEAFAKYVLDDYGLNEMNDHIQLSYMFSNKSLKTMAHDTPPVYVSNTRQLQGFVALKKIEQLRLCVEITENKDDRAREKTKTNFSFSSEVEASEVESRDDNYSGSYDGCSSEKEEEDNEIDCSSIVEGENQNVGGEDETGQEKEEDDEFDSRFDMFDDSDGASSEDDNFSSYGESPLEDEESPTIPPKKIYQNFSMSGSKESEEVLLRLEMSSLNLAVGQRYESKADLERRLKLLTVRASTKGESPAFYVCIYESNHTCSTTERSNRCRNATPDILGELYKNFLGDVGPAVRPTSVGIAITKQFGVKMEYWKSYRTLKFAREIVQGTPESGFERLPSYLYMIIRENPSTFARLQIDENGKFMYVFLAFGASVNGFPFMRKVFVFDGTFLNGRYKGTLLTALAQDGNFQIFPIAFAVVDTENDDSWHWFFTQLKLLIPDDEGLAIISDRRNSIGKAITNVYPLASRGICTYHLYKNILGRYKGKDAFRLVKKAARCFRMSDFTQIFEEIEAINPVLHGYLQRADVRLWTRVHFPGERYNLMTTNIAKSMNRALSNARGLSIVRIFESIRVMMTRWFAERREDAISQRTTLTRGGRVTAARDLAVQRIDDHHTEVKYGSSGESLHVVNLVERKCTCRRFELEKLPCVHAIAAAEYRNVSRISMCSPYYTSNYLVSAYAESVMPVDSAQPVPELVANQRFLPPTVRQPPGRPKKNRMKSALEIALSNKRPRKEHTCSRCRQSGHNAKTCPM
ncbi:uncharacterized protein LOC106447796 [Brassica napus]|nr:uncharacterized protein LOC106447796 [Brassica napus]